MKFSIIYILVSLTASVAIGALHQKQIKPLHQKQIKPLPIAAAALSFQPSVNVSIGPNTIISAYPETGADFVIDYANGRVTVSENEEQTTYPAEVCRLDSITWSAVMKDRQYVTINAQTGVTERLIDGEYKMFTPEHP